MEIKKAVRRAVPIQCAFYGPTGSGKTVSALLMAAGLVGSTGKVVVIDTEGGRASIHADNKLVLAALPGGFDVIDLDPPYHPRRFIEAIELAEKAGYEACIIDSGSDSYDGPGGICDIAEAANDKWIPAKLANKRMMTRARLSSMHIIWCLKAQDKTKVIDKSKSASGKQEYIEKGMQPIWEKNNMFPQLLVFSVDPETHISTLVKHTADDLRDVFARPGLITKQHGELVRRWNEGGSKLAPHAQLIARAESVAGEGIEAYEKFFKELTPRQRAALKPVHEANKKIALKASVPVFGTREEKVDFPTDFDGPRLIWNGMLLQRNEGNGQYMEVKQEAMAS